MQYVNCTTEKKENPVPMKLSQFTSTFILALGFGLLVSLLDFLIAVKFHLFRLPL